MQYRVIIKFIVICAVLMFIPQVSGGRSRREARGAEDYPKREEIERTFQLSRDARVEVSGVAGGPVDIETTDGNTAEVHIVRSAQTRTELDCYKTVIEHTPDSLTVRHEQATGRAECRSIRASQRVRLRVPRSVELNLKSIGGDVNVGDTDGVLRLNGIAGHVKVNHSQTAEIAGLAKGLTMTIRHLGERGIRISGVVGHVELNLAKNLNADLRVSNIIGVDGKAPGVTTTKVDASNSRTRIGRGGPPISISGVVGSIAINHSTN